MTTTPQLGITELETSADGRTIFNEGVRKLEQFSNFIRCDEVDRTAPPASPADGSAYFVNATATGDWAGEDNKLAYYQSSAWVFVTPADGQVIYDEEQDEFYRWDGSALVLLFTSYYRATINSPSTSEDYTLGFTEHAATVLEINNVVRGTTPSRDFTIRFAGDRSAAGTEVVTGGSTANSTSGSSVTSFNNDTIPANNWIWLETDAGSGTVDEMHVSVRVVTGL